MSLICQFISVSIGVMKQTASFLSITNLQQKHSEVKNGTVSNLWIFTHKSDFGDFFRICIKHSPSYIAEASAPLQNEGLHNSMFFQDLVSYSCIHLCLGCGPSRFHETIPLPGSTPYPLKVCIITYSPYKYEVNRMKTHEIRAKSFVRFFFFPSLQCMCCSIF